MKPKRSEGYVKQHDTSPKQLIETVASEGLCLTLNHNGELAVNGSRSAIEKRRFELKARKAALIDYLTLEQRIPQLVADALKGRDARYQEACIAEEILYWPAEDLTDMLNNPGLANCAIDCVAVRHRVWRFGEIFE